MGTGRERYKHTHARTHAQAHTHTHTHHTHTHTHTQGSREKIDEDIWAALEALELDPTSPGDNEGVSIDSCDAGVLIVESLWDISVPEMKVRNLVQWF